MNTRRLFVAVMAAILATPAALYAQAPQGMTFTYQGLLKEAGVALTGDADFIFHAWDADSGGNLIGSIDVSAVPVIDGLFTIELDFGAGVFNGDARWLEIEVEFPSGAGNWTTLSPRQPVTAAPYALYALSGPGSGGFWAASADDIYNTNAGDVGIGTTNPQAQLHVSSDSSTAMRVRNTSASGGTAISASATANSGYACAVNAYVASPDGRGIESFNEAESGNAYAVYGENISPAGIAIYGLAEDGSASSTAIGVYGRSNSDEGAGVYGEATHTDGTAFGVRGVATQGTGVQGENQLVGSLGALGRHYEGVYGESSLATSGIGVHGRWTGMSPGYGFGGAFTTTSELAAGVLARNEATESGGTGVLGVSSFAGNGEGYGGYFEAAATVGHGVHGEATGDHAFGVYGTATADEGWGVVGQADGNNARGVVGLADGDNGIAVYGRSWSSNGTGGHFETQAFTGRAIYGAATNSSSDEHYGGYFESEGSNGRGVYGFVDGDAGHAVTGEATGHYGVGVHGTASGYYGIGVHGQATDTSGSVHYGGYFESTGAGHALYAKTSSFTGRPLFVENLNPSDGEKYAGYFRACGNDARAVYGLADRTGAGSETTYGGYFEARANYGIGVYGVSIDPYYAGAGVVGEAFGEGSAGVKGIGSGIGWAGYFDGTVRIDGYATVTQSVEIRNDLDVWGTVTKGGGSFKIDHPLDPENKYLYHSFVESPDMMNVYNGNVVTDDTGAAWVSLPEWFEALNRDYRYQLTVIGEFAQAIIAKKIKDNRFLIRTDKPHIEVSWQVTGIRHDPFAEANRIPVEVEKPADQRGTYLHPEAWGVPEDCRQ